MRHTKLIEQTGPVDLTFAGDIAIANVGGTSNVYVVPSDELDTVDSIDSFPLRNNIFNSMYRLQPGERRQLTQGKYHVILGGNAMAFLSYKGATPKPTKAAN